MTFIAANKLYKVLFFIILIWAIGCVPVPPETPTPGDGGQTPIPTPVPTIVPTPVPTPTPVEEYNTTPVTEYEYNEDPSNRTYQPRGVGGGGAMSGFSISPYSSLWFVGTDMGTLFRSPDRGLNWEPVHHFETTFSSDLTAAVGVGFTADPLVVLHAPGGKNVVRSQDGGKTFSPVTIRLTNSEYIRYWRPHSYDFNYVYAGTNLGLWQSKDNGKTWSKLTGVSGESKGTYIDYHKDGHIIYHATSEGIWKSTNQGVSFNKVYTAGTYKIRAFTAGRDKTKITFAIIDSNGAQACSDVAKYLNDWGQSSLNAHYAHCGYVWTAGSDLVFQNTMKAGGDYLKMAENNSDTIVAAGSTSWIRQYGTKIWRSDDRGANWKLTLFQMNWDVIPFAPWEYSRLEYSAPALEIGWYDNGYESFDMHQRSPASLGGTGYFFLHTSKNKGENWQAPFTKYADTGTKTKGKKWSSTGLEVTTVYRFEFHPQNSQVAYAAMADISGMVSEDGGNTFRVTTAGYNSIYDYSFDPSNDQLAYAAVGAEHDYPISWHANATKSEGGIYKTSNRGRSWTRLTPKDTNFNRQFLSVGYDFVNNVLYGGSQGDGVARSTDGGSTWTYYNNGLPAGINIIPQIEIDPDNGEVYILVTGDAPNFTNQTKTGIYKLVNGVWTLLRGIVKRPQGVTDPLWYYPTGFAVDFSNGSDRTTLWLIDYENNRNWLATGIWKSTDRGQNWNRMQQYTHPLAITLDQDDPRYVYVGGLWQLDGGWGEGGNLYSNDGGITWQNNEEVPYQHNGRSVTIDPNDSNSLFYTFFGSALLYGPRP